MASTNRLSPIPHPPTKPVVGNMLSLDSSAPVQNLARLAKDKRIQLVGINYKDQPDNARRFLNRYGNPFAATGVDERGRAAIDWGVYGVPENFLIGRDGRIAYKLVGPITAENLAKVLGPEIDKALAK